MRDKWTSALSVVGLLALAVAYALPRHPSAGTAVALDAIVHAALFAGIGLWFGWLAGRRAWVFLLLATLAALLEVVQWWLGGYPQLEWRDILANEIGLGFALMVLVIRARPASR